MNEGVSKSLFYMSKRPRGTGFAMVEQAFDKCAALMRRTFGMTAAIISMPPLLLLCTYQYLAAVQPLRILLAC